MEAGTLALQSSSRIRQCCCCCCTLPSLLDGFVDCLLFFSTVTTPLWEGGRGGSGASIPARVRMPDSLPGISGMDADRIGEGDQILLNCMMMMKIRGQAKPALRHPPCSDWLIDSAFPPVLALVLLPFRRLGLSSPSLPPPSRWWYIPLHHHRQNPGVHALGLSPPPHDRRLPGNLLIFNAGIRGWMLLLAAVIDVVHENMSF